MHSIGVRELKNKLSRYLDRVKAGEAITITEHSRPIARLLPVEPTVPDTIFELIDRGEASWGGGKPGAASRPVRTRKGILLAGLVIEDRR